MTNLKHSFTQIKIPLQKVQHCKQDSTEQSCFFLVQKGSLQAEGIHDWMLSKRKNSIIILISFSCSQICTTPLTYMCHTCNVPRIHRSEEKKPGKSKRIVSFDGLQCLEVTLQLCTALDSLGGHGQVPVPPFHFGQVTSVSNQ